MFWGSFCQHILTPNHYMMEFCILEFWNPFPSTLSLVFSILFLSFVQFSSHEFVSSNKMTCSLSIFYTTWSGRFVVVTIGTLIWISSSVQSTPSPVFYFRNIKCRHLSHLFFFMKVYFLPYLCCWKFFFVDIGHPFI